MQTLFACLTKKTDSDCVLSKPGKKETDRFRQIFEGKQKKDLVPARVCLIALLFIAGWQTSLAQPALRPWGDHVLTNQVGVSNWAYFALTVPGSHSGFALTAQNLSGSGPVDLFIANGTANPTDSVYLKRSVAGSNILEMSAGELSPGEYRIGLLFQGATAGTTAQNRLRLIPFLSTAGGAITNQVVNGGDLYFRLSTPAAYPGLRATLSKTNNAGIELSAYRGLRPDSSPGPTLLRQAVGSSPETVWLNESETASPTNFLLCVAGAAAGTNTVTLRWEPGVVTILSWDPGTADGGTLGFTNAPGETGGLRFFRLNPQASVVGAWRTVLRVTSGSAQFYMQNGALSENPLGGAAGIPNGPTGNSARIYYAGQYSPGQDWHITVNSSPGSQWSLLSGEAFVQELGEVLPPDPDLANTTINTNATTAIGPEGVRFFRATVTNGTPAWRLWLNNGTASPATRTNFIEVRQTQVPVPGSNYRLRQAGQMLVVPPELNEANVFFLGVSGTEGTALNLDSRVHRIEDLAYGANLISQAINGFRYRTFRVYVPSNSIAWQVTARTLSGDVDIALRKTEVANENSYLARADATGTTSDSIALVPPTLSDGNYFITAYGKSASTFTLQQGAPIVTDIPFVNSVVTIPGYSCPTCTNGPVIVNDDPDRNGWRYYKVSDVPSQLGVFGWLLALANQSPGTEIALRRNALPGRWSTGAHLDFSTTSGYLERQAHVADIWYVGIYSPTAALGPFQLETRPFVPTPMSIPSLTEVTNQRPASWEYFSIDVPTSLADSNLLGLEIQLTNASGNNLRLQMRRDNIPYDVGSGVNNSTPTWPSGNYVSGVGDWTDRGRPFNNSDYLFLPMGWPLQPGRYYVGVRNDSAQPRSYGLSIATVGNTNSGKTHLIQSISGEPGMAVGGTNLNPREFRLYRMAVATNTSNLRLQLNVTQGEARLFIRRNNLPGLPGAVGDFAGIQSADTAIARIQRAGSETVTILPGTSQTNIPAGDYFLLVAAEGTVTNYASGTIGAGPTSYELSVLPPITQVHLGTFGPGQELVISTNFAPPERRFYTIDIQPSVKALELRFENLAGDSYFQWADHSGLLECSTSAFGGNAYGWIGGWGNYQRITGVLNLIPPAPGRYSFVIESKTGIAVSHSARLTITAQDASLLTAEAGDVSVTNQPPQGWRFFRVDVPATAGGGPPAAWDLRLENVSNDAVYLAVGQSNFPAGLGNDASASVRTTWPTNPGVSGDAYLTRRHHGLGFYNKEVHLGWGWPISEGTYYVGVLNGASQPAAYHLTSRLIGGSASSLPKKVQEIAWGPPGVLGSVSNLSAGEARYFHLPVPPNTPMLRLRLTQLRGEGRMTLRRGSVPGTHLYQGDLTTDLDWYAAAYARIGDEEMTMLPRAGTNAVPPGDYFITLVSEGENPPNTGTLGTNSVDLRLERLPDVQSLNFGAVVPDQTVSLTNVTTWPNRAYGYLTIPQGARSLQIIHQPLTNQSRLYLRPGTNLISGSGPATPNNLDLGQGTWSGGESPTYAYQSGNYTWNNPPPGIYTLLLDAIGPSDTTAAAITSFTLSGETLLDFTNGEAAYLQAPVSWRYFRVDVPTNAANSVRGWEVRLADSPSNEGWNLYIRRDELPDFSMGLNYVTDANTSWPSGKYYGGQGFNWTGRGVPGMANSGYFASMAWGRPLQPGTYFIGIYNGSAQPRSIRLLTRAIGDPGSGLPIQIESLAFGATLTVSNLPPGALKYYRMTNLPPNLAAAKWTLRAVQGDARWHVRRGAVPGVTLLDPYGQPASQGSFPGSAQQIGTSVPGNDYMIWWPQGPATALPADDYYFIVAAEGSPNNPEDGMLGSGPTSFEITSTAFTPTSLGTVTPNHPIGRDAGYDAGEPLAFNFDVPAGTRALEVRLENRVGNPVFELGRGSGHYGGFAGWFGNNITNGLVSQARYFVLPEPPADNYWLDCGQAAGQRQAGSFRLSIRSLTNEPLNFSSLLNTNGQINVITGSLADGQRRYFTVDVPESLAGEPVLGWYLKLERLQGNPQVRLRRGNSLPQAGNADTSSYFAGGLVVAPPYFRSGPWVVEVLASGDSQFALTSERVALERPTWFMPPYGQVTTNAGIASPGFADSSISTNGTPLTNHVSLAQGRYHFYAVDVPEGNGGLLRAELLAHSGNPDLYVRTGDIPSLEAATFHPSYGWISAYELSLTSGAGSEFANWVPADSRREVQLKPGRWYFMVHANGSNVRYQLKLGTGQMTELPLSGGSAANQTVAANDWRYYRFLVPTNPPQFWDLTVAQSQGDVDVWVRDTAPPGDTANGIASWLERKNEGVNYQYYPTPGTWRFSVPQIRPGHVYYVGVRAVADSTFPISSTTSGPLLSQAFPDFDLIDSAGGVVSLTLAPFERKTWRLQIPPDAPRWKHFATNSSAVRLYLQNGSVPWAARDNPGDHWSSGGAINSVFEISLADRTQGGWPWVRGETYFIAATNESAIAQSLSLRLDSRAWLLELAATNGTISRSPNKPYYETGEIVSLTPQPATGYRFAAWAGDLSGTNQPGQITMTTNRRVVAVFEPIQYQISISATGGTVLKNPATPTYPNGSYVTLTAIPAGGYEFVRWTGSVASFENPLLVQVTGNLSLTAEFQQVATPPEILAGSLIKLAGAGLRFNVTGQAGKVLDIQASADLVNWTSLFLRTNSTGTVTIMDSEQNQDHRFYRAVQQP
jgi:hypothetical protein